MNRRDFITLWIQALLLALFPWLRTERGIEAAGRAAEAMVADRAIFKSGDMKISMSVKGFEVDDKWMRAFMRNLNDVYVPGSGPAANFLPLETRPRDP